MRRIVLWLMSTITVVVLLFGYHTSSREQPVATGTTAPAQPEPTPTAGSPTGTPPPPSSTSASPSSGSSPSGSGGDPATTGKTTTGDVVQTRWGPVQVKITTTGNTITAVTVVQSPSGNPRDLEINSQALPVLVSETLDAQNADIDMVSGATVTGGGYVQSLQSALDAAGIS